MCRVNGVWTGKVLLPQQGSVFAQIVHRGARQAFAEFYVVEVDACLQVVAPRSVVRGQKQRGLTLLAAGVCGQVFKVAALGLLRGNFVGAISMRFVTVAESDYPQTKLQQSSAGEAMLIAQVRQPGDGIALGRALLRHEGREAVVGRMVVVEEQSGGEDVRGGQIYLDFGQIAATQQMVGIRIGRKPLNVDVVVFRFQTIEEPGAIAHDGPGNRDPGNELVEAQPVALAKRGQKICGVEAELVVAHAGIESYDAPGSFAELNRVAGGLGINRAHRIRTDPHGELSAGGGADIESIQQIEGGVGLGSGHMNLPRSILHHARGEGQQIADVARSRIRQVDDGRRIEGAFVGDLFEIDAAWGRDDIHLLEHYLLMGQLHFHELEMSVGLVLRRFIKALLLHAKLVR